MMSRGQQLSLEHSNAAHDQFQTESFGSVPRPISDFAPLKLASHGGGVMQCLTSNSKEGVFKRAI
jgi:hypothetical protein